MSNHTNRELYSHPEYIHRHVGGKIKPINQSNYLKQQMELIHKNNKKLPPQPNMIGRFGFRNNVGNKNNEFNNNILNSNDFDNFSKSLKTNSNYNDNNYNNNNIGFGNIETAKGIYYRPETGRFDPYVGFLHYRGLIDDGTNRRRFITNYVNIDSAFRESEPSTVTEEAFLLNNDPLDFNAGSNTIFINHKNNGYSEGDLITLNGVLPKQTIIKTFRDDNSPSFIIPAGCNFMKVFFPHGLPSTYNGNEIQVEFQGIRGNRGTVETSSFLGNIPTNILNSKYSIRLSLSEEELTPGCDLSLYPADFLSFSPDAFFVILPKTMHNPSSDPPYLLREYNYKIIFLSIAGIPINLLNADYPINPNRRNGFHNIFNVSDNGYNIQVGVNAILDENGGGSCIYASRIDRVNIGYPNPNSYIIELGETFHDIISVKLVSIEFPNSEQVVKNLVNKTNNKMYWNDIDDGDFLYCIVIPPGNYTPSTLSSTMERLFFQTPRTNAGQDIGATYTPNHYVQVNMDTNTDIVSFQSFKEFILVEPIIAVTPEISTDSALDSNPSDTEYVITINHPGHGMAEPGERILITGAIEHLGIPPGIINAEHDVLEIVDDDTYRIKLPRFNLLDVRTDSGGGVSTTIFIPDQFRLRMDFDDSIGQLLGFRNIGNPNSITPFSSIITNGDPYEFDSVTNVLGEPIDITNNSIQLSGDNYVLMIAKPLVTLKNIGPVKNVFAKILLCDLPGKVLFNSHVNTSRYYEDPIHELSELEIEFYSPNGELFDFNGLNHSFTLEIITVHDIPGATHVSANTGKNYNIVV